MNKDLCASYLAFFGQLNFKHLNIMYNYRIIIKSTLIPVHQRIYWLLIIEFQQVVSGSKIEMQ